MFSNAHYSFWELDFEATLPFSLATHFIKCPLSWRPTVEVDGEPGTASGNILMAAIAQGKRKRKTLKCANVVILLGWDQMHYWLGTQKSQKGNPH